MINEEMHVTVWQIEAMNVVVLCVSGHWLTEVWLPELSFFVFFKLSHNAHKYCVQGFDGDKKILFESSFQIPNPSMCNENE